MLVGAGSGPCAVLAIGARKPGKEVVYPVDPVARRHGAGLEVETPDPAAAYAAFPLPEPGPYRAGALLSD